MDIDQYSQGLTEFDYYSKGFRVILEDHMTFLRTHPNTKPVEVTPGEAYRYESDFYGLLTYKAIPMHLHHLILRMNNMMNPAHVTADLKYFLLPDQSVVSRLLSVYKTGDRLST